MTKKEREFQTFLIEWYAKCGRHDLPWRQTHDPYLILVSELMLQQTQVVRVIPKYEAFILEYPTVDDLAAASLGDVLRLWQGLGYNRRAKFLLQCAQQVSQANQGVFPSMYDELLRLPGIGPYTASAICAFAYNQSVELIETNVRQVMIHHFFAGRESVSDTEILEQVRRTLPADNARAWYAALMDYGSHLKALNGNNTRIVSGYSKQSTFKGSTREVRAAIIRILSKGSYSHAELLKALAHYDIGKIQPQLDALLEDEMIAVTKDTYHLP